MNFREAQVGDEADIIRLSEQILEAEGLGSKIKLTKESYKNYLEKPIARRPFKCLVATGDNNKILGFALWYEVFLLEDGQAMHLEALAVDRSTRHEGIGTALIERLKQIARLAGYPDICFLVHKDNTSAKMFYKKHDGKIDSDWDYATILVN